MWCVWHDLWSGTFEWICGRARAEELLDGGMTKINGKPVEVKIVDEGLGWVQIRATVVANSDRAARYDWELLEVAA